MTPADRGALLARAWKEIAPANPVWESPSLTPPLPDRVPLDRSTVFSQYGFSYRHANIPDRMLVSQPFARVRFVLDSQDEPSVDLLGSQLEVLGPQGVFPLRQTERDILARTGPRLVDLLRRAVSNELEEDDAESLVAWYELQYRIHGAILQAVEPEHEAFARWITYRRAWPRKVAAADPSATLPKPIRIEVGPDTALVQGASFDKAPFVVLVVADATATPPRESIAERSPLRFDEARAQALAPQPHHPRLVELWRRIELVASAADSETTVEVLPASPEELATDFEEPANVSRSGLFRRIGEELHTRPFGAIVVDADFFARSEVAHGLGHIARESHLVVLADTSSADGAALDSFRKTEEARSVVPCTSGDGPFLFAAAMARSQTRYGIPAFPEVAWAAAEGPWTLFESAFGERQPFASQIFLDALARHAVRLAYHQDGAGSADADALARAITDGFRATFVGGPDFEVWIEEAQPLHGNDRQLWGAQLQLAVSFSTMSGKLTSATRWLTLPRSRR